MNYDWYDILGNIGVVMILSCYLALQLGKMKSEDLIYSVLNGLGAALILISLIYDFNFSAFLIELFWLLISMVGIFNGIRRNRVQNH
jgi:hypothetical protein